MSTKNLVTFALIKPMTYGRGQALAVLDKITKAGFSVLRIKTQQPCRMTMSTLYKSHEGEPYYDSLVEAMLVNTTVPMLLGRYDDTFDTITAFRQLIGPTKSLIAPKTTIRGMFGGHLYRGPDAPVNDNVIHASDSAKAVSFEASLFFKDVPEVIKHFCEFHPSSLKR